MEDTNIALLNSPMQLFLKKMTNGRCVLTQKHGKIVLFKRVAYLVLITGMKGNKIVLLCRNKDTKSKISTVHHTSQVLTVNNITTTLTNSGTLKQNSIGQSSNQTKKRTNSSRESRSEHKIDKEYL